MQAQIHQIAKDVATLTTTVATQNTTQALNHAQNRKDIHDLRNGQQRYMDAMNEGFEKVADSITKAIKPMQDAIFELQMWKSKTTGYVLGMTAVASIIGAVIFTVVKEALAQAMK